jgi:pimeloyl-ACP methyl ester carboxylesterase
MAIRFPTWTGRAALAVVGLFILLVAVSSWLHANAIRAELMVPLAASTDFDLVVESNEAGRATVNRTPASDKEGIWGLEGPRAYAQLSTIVRVTETTVERGIRALESEFAPGDAARIDADAFAGDPETAHGFGWESRRIPSDIGPHPAWFVDGRRATWVIFVHGRGDDRLEESLRILPSLVEQGFPVLSIAFRNDVGATSNESGLRYWGLEEWRDLDAAVGLGVLQGAKDFVVIGSGFGTSVVSTFLHESENVGLVKGVVFDSPILDIEAVAIRYAQDRGTPAPIAWLGRKLVSLRFGMDWNELDQFDRTDQFDVPILLLYGAKDPHTDVSDFERFANLMPDLVVTERFEQAGHTDLWNIDSTRYEEAISEFLLLTAGSE